MTRHEYALWGAKAIAKRGQELPHSKLCPDHVRQIRDNPRGLTAKQHAAELGIHYRTVEKVRAYETWGHV